MFRSQVLRASSHLLPPLAPRAAFVPLARLRLVRPISTTSSLYKDGGRRKAPASVAADGSDEHEGSFARTDKDVRVEYPEEHELPSSVPVQGRGGLHFKRTLASFSLEGRVGVVTGGARGLGLVMSQALVVSGADVAIVDLNSTCTVELAMYESSRRPKCFCRRGGSREASSGPDRALHERKPRFRAVCRNGPWLPVER